MGKSAWLVLALLVALVATPAAAAWRVAETKHFRLHGNLSESSLVARAALLEDYRAMLVSMTTGADHAEQSPRLDIFIVDSMAQALPFTRLRIDIAGVYVASAGRIAAFAEDGDNGQQILLHEYAHHFMLGSSSTAYPPWYVEGFAEYFMTSTFRPDRIEVGHASPGRYYALVNGPLLPMERLLAIDPKLRGRVEDGAYYAQAWALTHYLYRTPGMTAKLQAYLRAVAAGADPVAAFRAEIDADLPGFARLLRSYVDSSRLTYSRFKRSPVTPATVKVTLLGPAADPMLLQLTSLELGVPKADRARAMAAVRNAATARPDDPLTRRTLAYGELADGDPAQALAMIDTLLATRPDDAILLRWRAQALLAAGRPASEAARLLARSFKADPDDWRTLLMYVGLSHPETTPLDAARLDAMLRAYELAPQVPEVVLMTAVALAQAGDLARAGRVLEALAYAPHRNATRNFATMLLARARAGDRNGFLAAFRADTGIAADDVR